MYFQTFFYNFQYYNSIYNYFFYDFFYVPTMISNLYLFENYYSTVLEIIYKILNKLKSTQKYIIFHYLIICKIFLEPSYYS